MRAIGWVGGSWSIALSSVPPWLVIASRASDAERPAVRRTRRVLFGPLGVVVVVGGTVVVVAGGAVVVVGASVDGGVVSGVVVSGVVVSGVVVSGAAVGVVASDVVVSGVCDDGVVSANAIVAGVPMSSSAVVITTSARALPVRNRFRRAPRSRVVPRF